LLFNSIKLDIMAIVSSVNYNIVLAHDNEIVALGYQDTLQSTEDQSYTVHVIATNEHDAFLKIMEVNPELVITCYESTEFDAQRMIKSLMNYPAKQRPGILVVGPQIEDKLLRQLTLMGALDYLVEPIPINKFRVKVKNAISTFLFKKEKDASAQGRDVTELLAEYQKAPHDYSYAPKIDMKLLKDKLGKFKNLEWNIDANEIKQSADSWLFLAQGPTPEYGRWTKTDIPNKWLWTWSKETLAAFAKDDIPEYFFEGVEPKWAKGKWENGRWVMGGRNPSLSIKGLDKTQKDIINFDNGSANISPIDIVIPSSLMESLAVTNKNEGQSKVMEILASCHYTKKDMEKLLPGIIKLSDSITQAENEAKKRMPSLTESFAVAKDEAGKEKPIDMNTAPAEDKNIAPITIGEIKIETEPFKEVISVKPTFEDELKGIEKTVKVSAETVFEKEKTVIKEPTIKEQTIKEAVGKEDKPIIKKKQSLFDRAVSGEFKTGNSNVIDKQSETPASPIYVTQFTGAQVNADSSPDQLSSQEYDELSNFFDMPVAELSNIWTKSGAQDLFTMKASSTKKTATAIKEEMDSSEKASKAMRRLNILNQAMDDCKRRLSNIQVTIIDILDSTGSADIVLTNDTIKPDSMHLSYNYLANQIFKDIRQVVKVELTDDKFNTFIYPYFSSQDKLVGVVMFRKTVPKTAFTMNDKIICSALANSIKTAFTSSS
jgi:DNA-binding NarL/FixJ family response regulator